MLTGRLQGLLVFDCFILGYFLAPTLISYFFPLPPFFLSLFAPEEY